MKKVWTIGLVVLVAASFYAAERPALAQNSVYVTVDYMKVAPGQGAAYEQFEKELYMPVHRERVNAGQILGWYLYGVWSPSGTEVHHNYAVVTIYGSFEALADSYPEGIWEKVHPGVDMDEVGERTITARDLVRWETWQQLDAMPETPLDAPTPFLAVDYMKVPTGGGAQYIELEQLWKKVHQVRIKEGTMASWGLYSRVFPGGSDYPYDYATANGYGEFKNLNDLDLESLIKKAGLGMSVTEAGDRTVEARDLVREEVWYLIDHVQASGQ